MPATGAVALVEHAAEVEQALVALGDRDVGGVEQLGADDQGRGDEDAGHQVGDAVVEPHHPHVGRGVPALLAHPVAVRRERDRAADAAGDGQRREQAALGHDRRQPGEQVEQVGDGERRGHHHRDEHQADEERADLLEQAVAAQPHQGQADQAGQDAPRRRREHREQVGEREPGAGHRGGAVDEAPDHDVGAEVDGGPRAEGGPALVDRVAGRERVAARALDQHDLHHAADDHRPEERVAVGAAGDQGGDQVGGTDTGGGDDEAGSDEGPAGSGLACL